MHSYVYYVYRCIYKYIYIYIIVCIFTYMHMWRGTDSSSIRWSNPLPPDPNHPHPAAYLRSSGWRQPRLLSNIHMSNPQP